MMTMLMRGEKNELLERGSRDPACSEPRFFVQVPLFVFLLIEIERKTE